MEKRICSNCGADTNPENARFCTSCGHELAKVKVEPNFQKQVKQKKVINKKQLLGTVLGVLVFWAAYYGVQQIFFNPSIDKALMTTASEINKVCPIMVDKNTRFDNAVAMPKNTFQYNYTLVGEEMTSINSDSLKNFLEPRLVNLVKTSPDMGTFRKNKTTMVYNYRNEQGEFVTKIVVSPDMYKE